MFCAFDIKICGTESSSRRRRRRRINSNKNEKWDLWDGMFIAKGDICFRFWHYHLHWFLSIVLTQRRGAIFKQFKSIPFVCMVHICVCVRMRVYLLFILFGIDLTKDYTFRIEGEEWNTYTHIHFTLYIYIYIVMFQQWSSAYLFSLISLFCSVSPCMLCFCVCVSAVTHTH